MRRDVLRTGRALLVVLGAGCSGRESSGERGAPGAPVADSVAAAAPVDEVRSFEGMMTDPADAPRFTDCSTGRSFGMAREGDYLAAERAYLDARGQGEPLLVRFDGRATRRPGTEGGGVDVVVVTDFRGARPGLGCGAEPVEAPLEGTEWRLVAVGGTPVGADVHATLRLEPDTRGSSGSTGCNRFTGGYDLVGGRLTVSLSTLTRSVCPEPLAGVEADFLEALRVAGGYRFVGRFLELLGETGPVARFTGGGS